MWIREGLVPDFWGFVQLICGSRSWCPWKTCWASLETQRPGSLQITSRHVHRWTMLNPFLFCEGFLFYVFTWNWCETAAYCPLASRALLWEHSSLYASSSAWVALLCQRCFHCFHCHVSHHEGRNTRERHAKRGPCHHEIAPFRGVHQHGGGGAVRAFTRSCMVTMATHLKWLNSSMSSSEMQEIAWQIDVYIYIYNYKLHQIALSSISDAHWRIPRKA